MFRPQRNAGFTLVELMIVVVIIGAMAASVGPALAGFLNDIRHTNAAESLVKLGRRARAMTLQSGVAHLLILTEDSTGRGLGSATLWQGMNNRCRQTPWAQRAAVTDDNVATRPVEFLSFDEFNPKNGVPKSNDTGRDVIRMDLKSIAPDGTVTDITEYYLCFQPNGLTFGSTADPDTQQALTPQRSAIDVEIKRSRNNVINGVTRVVQFSSGGNARIRR
jgi:prepilin-type N-terminal cleavage/methylation domain-containing protein